MSLANEHLLAAIRKNQREEIRVVAGEFNGVPIVSLRIWFKADDGEMRPGKAGLAFRKDIASEVAEAIRKAVAP
jgi:Transcriptional Coactivator p15 (PC4)